MSQNPCNLQAICNTKFKKKVWPDTLSLFSKYLSVSSQRFGAGYAQFGAGYAQLWPDTLGSGLSERIQHPGRIRSVENNLPIIDFALEGNRFSAWPDTLIWPDTLKLWPDTLR